MIKVTVFTPTYNRAYLLPKLYQSLVNQTNKNFEWLLVDDGSTDDTSEVVAAMIREDKILIKYYNQANSGKHIAINKGVELCSGELFFIVDSDDNLPEHSIDTILAKFKIVEDRTNFAGVCGRKSFSNGISIGSSVTYEDTYTTILDFRYWKKVKGDMAEVFKTEVLRKFPFPVYQSEKFCPEALIWNRISGPYNMLFFNQNIYTAEYLSDGLTASIIKVRIRSPNTSMLYYSELAKASVPTAIKIKSAINYWRFSYHSSKKIGEKFAEIGFFKSLIGSVAGYLQYKKDLR
jgi:glycosyltransferase involved in cell wall biosynthesis